MHRKKCSWSFPISTHVEWSKSTGWTSHKSLPFHSILRSYWWGNTRRSASNWNGFYEKNIWWPIRFSLFHTRWQKPYSQPFCYVFCLTWYVRKKVRWQLIPSSLTAKKQWYSLQVKKAPGSQLLSKSWSDAHHCRYSFAKENGLGGSGVFCFPVRFVHCKYNTPILKKEYSKPTTFLPKTYRKPAFLNFVFNFCPI